MAPNFDSLTVLFPMWNEELTIVRTVNAAREIGDKLVDDGEIGSYEVLIVDDASTDATGELADKLATDDERIRVVHHPVNRKLGGSIKTGLAASRGQLVLYTDADLPFDLADLAKAVRLLRVYDADIVSAYRLDRTGEGWRRALYSFLYNALVRSLLSLPVRDVNFAFKLVRREVLDHVRLRSEGSFIDVELLARARRLGFGIIQFGVDFFPRTKGVSTLSSAPVILRILREMTTIVPVIRRLEPLPPEVRRPSAAPR
ncbi:MAG: glycosyltransferase family 2 protein [Actinobacteria bacterium]|nr:glycosyltransferase family 2 protein [Actinomycetota bacterium]MBW3642760.1 glycosyltransferase family 2 protein [Actinomycetota bacterium]